MNIDTSKCTNIGDNFDTDIDINYIQDKIKKIKEEFSAKQIERDELASLLILALFSKVHLFLLGPPGISKTGGLNIFATCVENNKLFEICIKDDTKYQELFGEAIEHEGTVKVNFEDTIVTSVISIIDEIWKGNSRTMNSLLSIASKNRTAFIRGAGKVTSDLSSIFAASNELAQDTSLAALSDRFSIKYLVNRISEDENWKRFITKSYDTNPEIVTKVTLREINSVHYNAVYSVSIPDYIVDVFLRIKKEALKLGLNISDRRFDDSQIILKTSAFLNNRNEVDLSDFFILRHILWTKEHEIVTVYNFLNEVIFGNPDIITIEMNNIKSNIKNLDTSKEIYLNDFMNFRVNIQEDNVYETYTKNLINIYEAYREIYIKIEKIENRHDYCMNVEQLVHNNIFIEDFKQTNFNESNTQELKELENIVSKTLGSLINWYKQNDAKYKYNENKDNFFKALHQ